MLPCPGDVSRAPAQQARSISLGKRQWRFLWAPFWVPRGSDDANGEEDGGVTFFLSCFGFFYLAKLFLVLLQIF